MIERHYTTAELARLLSVHPERSDEQRRRGV
jgi:hypothetical protein